MTFELTDITVSFDDAGVLQSVRHPSRTDGGYLEPGLQPSVEDWSRTSLITDEDEIEITYACRSRPGLSLQVRHTLSAGWGTRLAFSNTASDVVTLDRFALSLRSAPGYLGWAVPAGNAASFTAYPADGTGPLLGWTLRQGDVTAVDSDGIHLAPISLEPGSRYIAQLQWDIHDVPVRRHRPGVAVPPALCLTVGEPIEVDDEDTAIVADEAVAVTTVEGVRELAAYEPGRFPIELRSGRGTTRFEMEWVQPESQALAAAAEIVVDGPRTPAGIPRIRDGAAALVVQHALAEMTITDPDQASDALELFSAGLLDRDPIDVSAMETAYLCGEWLRTGDPDLLQVAEAAVLGMQHPTAGMGMAATRLCVAAMMAGRSVDPVLQHLNRIREQAGRQEDGTTDSVPPTLEMILVVQNNIDAPSDDLLTKIRAVCARLGYGLPGLAVDPIDAEALGYLIAVLGLLPDRVGDRFIDAWGITPLALADRFRPVVIARALDPAMGEAGVRGLAWLVLGREP